MSNDNQVMPPPPEATPPVDEWVEREIAYRHNLEAIIGELVTRNNQTERITQDELESWRRRVGALQTEFSVFNSHGRMNPQLREFQTSVNHWWRLLSERNTQEQNPVPLRHTERRQFTDWYHQVMRSVNPQANALTQDNLNTLHWWRNRLYQAGGVGHEGQLIAKCNRLELVLTGKPITYTDMEALQELGVTDLALSFIRSNPQHATARAMISSQSQGIAIPDSLQDGEEIIKHMGAEARKLLEQQKAAAKAYEGPLVAAVPQLVFQIRLNAIETGTCRFSRSLESTENLTLDIDQLRELAQESEGYEDFATRVEDLLSDMGNNTEIDEADRVGDEDYTDYDNHETTESEWNHRTARPVRRQQLRDWMNTHLPLLTRNLLDADDEIAQTDEPDEDYEEQDQEQ